MAALDDAPGIHSARWAGEGRDFPAAMARIERELKSRGAPPPWRAHFVSVLALAWPDDHVEIFEGRVDGRLVFPPRGRRVSATIRSSFPKVMRAASAK